METEVRLSHRASPRLLLPRTRGGISWREGDADFPADGLAGSSPANTGEMSSIPAPGRRGEMPVSVCPGGAEEGARAVGWCQRAAE